jgi:hypothetical protein
VSERTALAGCCFGGSSSSLNDGERTVKKLLLAIGFPAIAVSVATFSVATLAPTSAAWAQGYGYWGAPYTYGPGPYDYSGPYAPAPYAAPPSIYGYDPYGSAYNWDYYRVDRPGRGNNVESTR